LWTGYPIVKNESLRVHSPTPCLVVLHLLHLLIGFLRLQFKSKEELCAVLLLRIGNRLEVDYPSKLFDDPLRNNKSEPYSILIVLLCALNESKELEYLVLVLPWNADSSILDYHFQILSFLLVDNLHSNGHTAFPGELQRIRLEVEQHLHDSLLICVEYWIEFIE